MRIESLAYLVDFAELGSIAAVAQKNFMSEQGISKVFTQLERESGVILFRKEGRSLKLTAAGEDVVINARKVVDDYHKVQDVLGFYTSSKSKEQDEFYVYMTPCTTLCLAPLLDIQKPRAFPFAVNLREENLDVLWNANLIQTGNGIFLTTIPSSTAGQTNEDRSLDSTIKHALESGLSYQPLLASPVISLISASLPRPASSVMSAGDVAGQGGLWNSMGVACPKDNAVLDTVMEYIREENITAVTSNMQLIKQLIRRGQAAMFLPKLILASLHIGKGIAWLPLESSLATPQVEFGMLYAREHAGAQHLQSVRSFVEDTVRQNMQLPTRSSLGQLLI